MKNIILISVLIVLALIFAGCTTQTTSPQGTTTTTTQTGPSTTTVTTSTEEGTQTTTVTGSQVTGDWCQAGGNWTMASTGAQGEVNATWKIDKLETSGQYAGLCHVVYTVESAQGPVTVNYWFEEGGKNGYFEMVVNGQTIKQEWHSE